MLEGMYYNAMKVNKRKYSHKEYKIVDQEASEEETLTSTRSKQWGSALTRSRRWLTYLSKNKQMKKEIKHVKNTLIKKSHYLTKIHGRHLLKEGRTTLTKEKIKGPLTPMKALETWTLQITDSTPRRSHDEEAIQQKHHLMLKQYQDEVMLKHGNKQAQRSTHVKSSLKHRQDDKE